MVSALCRSEEWTGHTDELKALTGRTDGMGFHTLAGEAESQLPTLPALCPQGLRYTPGQATPGDLLPTIYHHTERGLLGLQH